MKKILILISKLHMNWRKKKNNLTVLKFDEIVVSYIRLHWHVNLLMVLWGLKWR